MKWIKEALAVCALGVPLVASAAGSASGTITHVFASSAYGDLIYVEVSGIKTGNPACSTGKAPYQFVLPRSSSLQLDMFLFLMNAREAGIPVTLKGLGTCGVDFTVETLGAVTN